MSGPSPGHGPSRPAASPLHLATGALLLVLVLWNIWATRELIELKERRIVAVSLSTLVGDFVAAEARNGGTPEAAAARTKLYLAATQAAVRSLAANGSTVLVSEAVAGQSVPDLTPAVRASVARAVAEASDAR